MLLCSAYACASMALGHLPRFKYFRLHRGRSGVLLWHKRNSHRPIALHWLLGRPAHHEGLTYTIGADFVLCLLWVKVLFHPVLECFIFLWHLQHQDSVSRGVWISAPSGWHCDDLFYPPRSWNPSLVMVTCPQCSVLHIPTGWTVYLQRSRHGGHSQLFPGSFLLVL